MGLGVYANPQSKVGNMCSPGFSCQIPSQNFPWCPERFPQGKTGRFSAEIRVGRDAREGSLEESLNSGRRLIAGGAEQVLYLDRPERIGSPGPIRVPERVESQTETGTVRAHRGDKALLNWIREPLRRSRRGAHVWDLVFAA